MARKLARFTLEAFYWHMTEQLVGGKSAILKDKWRGGGGGQVCHSQGQVDGGGGGQVWGKSAILKDKWGGGGGGQVCLSQGQMDREAVILHDNDDKVKSCFIFIHLTKRIQMVI